MQKTKKRLDRLPSKIIVRYQKLLKEKQEIEKREVRKIQREEREQAIKDEAIEYYMQDRLGIQMITYG
jgi:hypothetical protein